MKKSHGITLTVVAAMSIAARAQQLPPAAAGPVSAQTCEERRAAAKAAGVKFTEVCGKSASGAHSHGGFGGHGAGSTGG